MKKLILAVFALYAFSFLNVHSMEQDKDNEEQIQLKIDEILAIRVLTNTGDRTGWVGILERADELINTIIREKMDQRLRNISVKTLENLIERRNSFEEETVWVIKQFK